MFGVFLAVALAFAAIAAQRTLPAESRDPRLAPLLIVGYLARLLVSPFLGSASLYSYGAGTDATWYAAQADAIAKLWHFTGLHYVALDENPDLGRTSLPQNTFALIDYVNGEATHIGCTALVAALACVTIVNLYAIAIELGAPQKAALAVVATLSFMPGVLLYTADTYKEGHVLFFEFVVLRCALGLSRRFSAGQFLGAALGLLGLWGTRYYLIYALGVPVGLALLGVHGRSLSRVAALGAGFSIALLGLVAYTKGLGAIAEHATTTFEQGTGENMLMDNATGGSGVSFDTSTPYASFGPKLLYTLFSPFPWQRGSLALQVGKLETMVWYYLLFRAVRSVGFLWRTRRSDLLLLGSFIVPVFLMYTLSFSNVGLVLRERIGAVFAVSLLAAAGFREHAGARHSAGVLPALAES